METQVRRSYSAYAFAVLLFSLNIYVAHRLFTLEYSVHLESNEGSFMAISRYMAAHPFDLLWWPFWDCGLPFQNTYFPLLHMIVAAFSRLAGCSAALSFHAVCAFFYCLGPVTLFLLAFAMSSRPGYSFLAALMYSLISPSAFLIPAIGADTGGVWNPRRLKVLGYYGEGPHITAVSLLPVAILFLYLSVKHKRKPYYLMAGIFVSAVALTNAFGGVDLFLMVICLLSTVDLKSFKRNIIVTGLIAVLSYFWISPWIPPSLLRVIRLNSQTVEGNFAFTARSLLGVLILLVAFGLVWISTRSPRFPVHLRFFLLFAIPAAGIPLLAYALGIFVVPQPHRYHVEMEMALCLAIVFGMRPLLDRAPLRLRQALVAGVLIVGVVQTIHYVRYARNLIQPVDIGRTVEYKIARWMGQHYGGQRVMITGSISFWFNVFVDTPQFHGGHDPNVPNWIHRIALFTIFSGMNTGSRDAEISLLWLRAFGAEAITVPGPGSREYYHPILDPNKFDGVLPLLWREGDDSIYGIPNRSPSLAHVISAQAIVTRPPINGLDIEPLTRYVAALENPAYPLATLSWHNLHSVRIETAAQPGQVLSIQITYAPGWHALVNGAGRPIQKDGLGLMVLDPTCHGPCTIEMFYDGGTELKVARMASLTVMLGVLAWYIGLFARRRAPASTAI